MREEPARRVGSVGPVVPVQSAVRRGVPSARTIVQFSIPYWGVKCLIRFRDLRSDSLIGGWSENRNPTCSYRGIDSKGLPAHEPSQGEAHFERWRSKGVRPTYLRNGVVKASKIDDTTARLGQLLAPTAGRTGLWFGPGGSFL